MAAVIRDLAQVNADLQEQKERAENVDFKMITFSLAGKEYGVDIMNVKEIAKADKFTFVPNAASFVRGVYNLRGDIIPIVDLRTFFHLSVDSKKDVLENMLILHINDQVYGTIVDKIDKVVGINHEAIQPPHPIFGDINIKFISGVVEKEGELYIILDVVRIFTISDEEKKSSRSGVSDSGEYFVPPPSAQDMELQQRAIVDTAIGFIQESLSALRHFIVTKINDTWLHKRFGEWSVGRAGDQLQLKTASEADEFLANFESPCSGFFWNEAYANMIKKILPENTSANINVWNVGCGKGYETYSFACILKTKYPSARIKIWANDNDIMAVSQAPNMVYELDELPEYCRHFMVHGSNGYSFNPTIKDSIIFEYHDVVNEHALPELDIILMRDVLSYLPAQEQNRIVSDFSEKMKDRGMIILGRNEELTGAFWYSVADDPVSAYLHNA
jgi:purine-binding chemotaxis protein CheW